MNDFHYEVTGAPVIYTNIPPKPHNPLRRPKMNYKKFAVALAVYFVVSVVISVFAALFFPVCWVWVWLGWSLAYFCLIGKRAAIWLVHLYQNKAKDSTRLKCVFEPSCSEYMILCIQRYGVLIGGMKGWKRLLRCHPPNGGKDYPYEIPEEKE